MYYATYHLNILKVLIFLEGIIYVIDTKAIFSVYFLVVHEIKTYVQILMKISMF